MKTSTSTSLTNPYGLMYSEHIAEIPKSQEYENVYVLDTNIILDDANNILTLAETGLVILPDVVIDELDSMKVGFGEINYQAREASRIITKATNLGIKEIYGLTFLELSLDGNRVDIVQVPKPNKSGISDNDKHIIKTAKEVSEIFDNVVLLSNDVMCRTRALMSGVETKALEGLNENPSQEFIKYIEVPDKVIDSLDLMNINDLDPEYKKYNYCYHFTSKSGNQKIGYIVNTRINIITDDAFTGVPVQPLNLGQRFACAGMLDPMIDITIIEALSGSGKTLLALSAGIKAVKDKHYEKIVYIRNSVESTDKAEEVGFLPGLESKFEIYNYPLYDTLDFISQHEVDNFLTGKQSTYSAKNLIETYNIETMWNGAMRGRTLSNAFVIVDEVQNFSKKSLQTVITRLDKDCKLILIGSNRQIDNTYINKSTNGLSVILNSMSEENEVTLFGTTLDKVVRGRITEYAERIFES